MALKLKRSRSFSSQIIATASPLPRASERAANLARQIFLETPGFGHSLLSKRPLVYSEGDDMLRRGDAFSRQLARSVWKFQRQRQSFRRVGISTRSDDGLIQVKVRVFLLPPRLL